MVLPIFFIIAWVIAGIIGWVEREAYDNEVNANWIFWTHIVLIGMAFLTTLNWVGGKSELYVIDEKISVVTASNQERVEQVLPILNKYPAIEKDIIGNISPNAFAVLGDVYPQLKSNESYNAQAKIVSSNIEQIEQLKLAKIDTRKSLYTTSFIIWFLN